MLEFSSHNRQLTHVLPLIVFIEKQLMIINLPEFHFSVINVDVALLKLLLKGDQFAFA